MKKLTIGMATYDDYDGVYFTIQNLRWQLLDIIDDIEFIVVDNNPSSKHGEAVSKLVTNWVKGKYIPVLNKQSTSIRTEIFRHATSKYVLCIDCHVLIDRKGIDALLEYYTQNPDTLNLIQGPMYYDDLRNVTTHFDPVWRDGMYGIWALDKSGFISGFPFEIPMCGLGIFSCRTDVWPGFSEHFIGFGGEEGYIHEKFRKNGGICICLPQLLWLHRFNRPNGVPYKLTWEDRIWNYFVGWLELTKNPNDIMIEDIYHHFSTRIDKIKLDSIKQKALTLYGY